MESAAGIASSPPGGALPAAGLGRPSIRNLSQLLGNGRRTPRALALHLVQAGLLACDPGAAVERIVALEGEVLRVGDRTYELRPGGRVVVLGSGKASLAIAAALERVLGERLTSGIVVVRHREGPELSRIRLLEAAHPVPDARSAAAAREMLETAAGLGPDDLLIACFTGGSSALTSLAPEAVGEADKEELHRVLLASGMPIGDVNVVRKQVSDFKGGRLASAARPAPVINLTVSDVAGDPLDAITDPTVPNGSSANDAIAALRDWAVWEQVPASVRDHLLSQVAADPIDLTGAEIQTELLVTGDTACAAISAAARSEGATPFVLGTGIEDEAVSVGRILGEIAAHSARSGEPFPAPSVLVGCGGESTVRLGPGDVFGAGGPNREAALAMAPRIAGLEIAAVFIDTDGSDGSGAAAGAIVDGDTAARSGSPNAIRGALARHRSGELVEALGDAVDTGPTHTNVNDLFVIAIGAAAPRKGAGGGSDG